MKYTVTPIPLTRDNFAPYGAIISLQDGTELSAVAKVADSGDMAIKVVAPHVNTEAYTIPFLERHPKSTQAFIGMQSVRFCVIVADGDANGIADLNTLQCFVTDGTQGIQYHMNIWHAPFSVLQSANFVVIDRHPNIGDNKNINIEFTHFENDTVTVIV